MIDLAMANDVEAALDEVFDPCLLAAGHRMSVLALGLISRVQESTSGIEVGITFTEVGCQFTHRVMLSIEERLRSLGRFDEVRIVPDWSSAWTPERMRADARQALDEGRVRLAGRLGAQIAHSH